MTTDEVNLFLQLFDDEAVDRCLAMAMLVVLGAPTD